MSRHVLVAGGAGFIGSLTAQALLERGDQVTVLDNLSTGLLSQVPEGAAFVEASIGNRVAIAELLSTSTIDACICFAGLIAAGESMTEPGRYFANNVGETTVLLEELINARVHEFVFSSSAAVYGEPLFTPMTETHPTQPTSVYGETKLMIEQVLSWMARQGSLRYVALRYFNAAGAVKGHAEAHEPETHLIPLAISAAKGERPPLQVFGSDYPTPDGTCIRDYVHINDLASAHLAALDSLAQGTTALVCNLGTSHGYSVREVLSAIEQVTGLVVPFTLANRRLGDPAELVASCDLARDVLGWVPTRSSLNEIIADAWNATKGDAV
jgi:UDP-glucose 4-epimerase